MGVDKAGRSLAELFLVQFVKKGLIMRYDISCIIILSLSLLVSAFAWGEGVWELPWLSLPFGSHIRLSDVYFVDPQRGWTVGQGFIAHTDGGGWEAQYYDPQFYPRAVQFLTPTKG